MKALMDVSQIRRDFPILQREVHGKTWVYLDNAATSQNPAQVTERLAEYYNHFNANIHRGVYAVAEEATAAYELVREQTAAFIGAASAFEIVFTRNATEAINLVAHAWGRKFLKAGDEILLSVMEHHANLVPWQVLAQAVGAKLKFIPVTDEGRLDLHALPGLLSDKTRLVALTQMSNVLGSINPVGEIAEQAHARGALMLVDGAQSVPHLPVNVRELGCDFLAFSAHKMLGPTGVGILYARRELLDAMDPFMTGGEMIAEVQLERSTWSEVPWKYEAGTPNIGGVIAFGAALRYLSDLGMEWVADHEKAVTGMLLSRLKEVPRLRIYGPETADQRGAAVSFNLEGIHPHDLGTFLDTEAIAVRVGHHCAQPLMRRFDVPAMVRASSYIYTTEAEIATLVAALRKARDFFGV